MLIIFYSNLFPIQKGLVGATKTIGIVVVMMATTMMMLLSSLNHRSTHISGGVQSLLLQPTSHGVVRRLGRTITTTVTTTIWRGYPSAAFQCHYDRRVYDWKTPTVLTTRRRIRNCSISGSDVFTCYATINPTMTTASMITTSSSSSSSSTLPTWANSHFRQQQQQMTFLRRPSSSSRLCDSRSYYPPPSLSRDDGPADNDESSSSESQQQPPRKDRITVPELSSNNGIDDIQQFVDTEIEYDSYFAPAVTTTTTTTTVTPIYLDELNPSQVEAVTQPLDKTITRVIAGPGSGKTKVLTCRITYLLSMDDRSRVLAVTFTRKAASEMKDRLENLLRRQEELTTSTDQSDVDDEYDDIVRFDRHGDIVQEFAMTSSTADQEPVVDPPKGLERVELGTFHSVCAKIMRYNGDLLQDLPSVRRDMSMVPFVVVNIPPSGRDNPADADDDIVEDDEQASTTQLVPAEINLNGQFAIADQAEQLRILKECLVEEKIDLAEYAKSGLGSRSTEIKPIQILSQIGAMKEIFAQNGDPFQEENGQKKKGSSVGPVQRIARKVYYSYRAKLLTRNAVDFDDLILMTRELLLENIELRERLHKRWTHVLVDEFQDTSRTQLDLVKLLTSSSLFVVGDSDQSIYSWRGAHVGSLDDVKTEFESYGRVHTVQLKENYRSTSNIVRAAEKVISSKSDGSSHTDGTQADNVRQAMKPQRGAGPSPRVVACQDGRAEAEFVVDTILNMTAKDDLTPNSTVAVLYRTNVQSRILEEVCVANDLPYVIRGGAGGFYKRAEIKDCLCFLQWLHNGNDEGAMLRAIKTPSKGIGEKAIREFRDFCDVVLTHYRTFYPLSKKPTMLDILISMTDDGTDRHHLRDAILTSSGAPQAMDHISKRALNGLISFSSKMRDVRSKAYVLTLDQLIFNVTEDFKLMDHFNSISKSEAEFLDRKENVNELRLAAEKYESYGTALNNEAKPADVDLGGGSEGESALSKFLDDVALVSDVSEADEKGSDGRLVVNLMTIHASKGTEFDAVFVVGLEEGTLPSAQAKQKAGMAQGEESTVQLEEEKRLCYVAMTRAKTQLILTWRRETSRFLSTSNTKSMFQVYTMQRSRFLDAIVSKGPKNGRGSEKEKNPSKSVVTKQPISGAEKNRGSGKSDAGRSGLKGPGSRGSRSLTTSSGQLYGIDQDDIAMTSPPKTRRTSRVGPRGQIRGLFDDDIPEVRTIPEPASTKPNREPKKHSTTIADYDIIERMKSRQPPSLTSLSKPRMIDEQRKAPSNNNRKKCSRPSSSSSSNGLSQSQSQQLSLIDPAWFLPVGEKVVHRNMGKGVVLGHPPFSRIDDAVVTVQFENGKTMDFPALGSDVLPDF